MTRKPEGIAEAPPARGIREGREGPRVDSTSSSVERPQGQKDKVTKSRRRIVQDGAVLQNGRPIGSLAGGREGLERYKEETEDGPPPPVLGPQVREHTPIRYLPAAAARKCVPLSTSYGVEIKRTGREGGRRGVEQKRAAAIIQTGRVGWLCQVAR